MSRRLPRAALASVVIAVVVAGALSSDPRRAPRPARRTDHVAVHPSRPVATTRLSPQVATRVSPHVTTRVSPRVTVYVRPRVTAGDPGSPHAILYRFALAYGELSNAGANRRQRKLISLSTPPLLAGLRRGAPSAAAEVRRGLEPGERYDATVVSLSYGVSTRDTQVAAVVLQQQLVAGGRDVGTQVETSYLAALLRTAAGWRVSRFGPVP